MSATELVAYMDPPLPAGVASFSPPRWAPHAASTRQTGSDERHSTPLEIHMMVPFGLAQRCAPSSKNVVTSVRVASGGGRQELRAGESRHDARPTQIARATYSMTSSRVSGSIAPMLRLITIAAMLLPACGDDDCCTGVRVDAAHDGSTPF